MKEYYIIHSVVKAYYLNVFIVNDQQNTIQFFTISSLKKPIKKRVTLSAFKKYEENLSGVCIYKGEKLKLAREIIENFEDLNLEQLKIKWGRILDDFFLGDFEEILHKYKIRIHE